MISRTWQTAHKMKAQFGRLSPRGSAAHLAAAKGFGFTTWAQAIAAAAFVHRCGNPTIPAEVVTRWLSVQALELLSGRLISKELFRSVYDYSAKLSRIQKIYGSRTAHREVTELLFQRKGDVDCTKSALERCKR